MYLRKQRTRTRSHPSHISKLISTTHPQPTSFLACALPWAWPLKPQNWDGSSVTRTRGHSLMPSVRNKTFTTHLMLPVQCWEAHVDRNLCFSRLLTWSVRFLFVHDTIRFIYIKVKPPAPEKATAAPKVTETAYRAELNQLKDELTCQKHGSRGNNRWCFVRRDEGHTGEHIPIGLEEITLWARKMVCPQFFAPESCLTHLHPARRPLRRNQSHKPPFRATSGPTEGTRQRPRPSSICSPKIRCPRCSHPPGFSSQRCLSRLSTSPQCWTYHPQCKTQTR